MNWISNVVPPKVRSFLRAKHLKTFGSNVLKAANSSSTRIWRPISSSCPAPAITCASAPRRGLPTLFDDGVYEEIANARGAARSAEISRRQALYGPAQGKSAEDRRAGCREARHRQARRHGRHRRACRISLPRRLAGHGGGRGDHHRHDRRRSSAARRSSSSPPRAARACRKACCR